MTSRRFGFWAIAIFAVGFAAGRLADENTATAQERRVFELRTYTAPDGKLPNLLARFRDHTLGLFAKHGMENIGYWVPQDEPASGNTLIYLLAHDSREAAARSWEAFGQDPDWLRARDASQVDGPIVAEVQRVFLEAADFSPLK